MAAPLYDELRLQINKMLFNTKASYYFEPIVEKYFRGKSLLSSKAKVRSLTAENEDILTIELKPDNKWIGFKAGQYIEICVKINAVNYTRIFSISSSEEQFKINKTITITMQKQKDGKVTPWIFDNLKIGDFIKISAAKGAFTLQENNKPLLMIAGGSGITPFYSLLSKCVEENRNAVLIYYAKNKQHIFTEKLNTLAAHHQVSIYCLSSDLEGRLTKNLLTKYCPDFYFRQIYICGPNTMIADTSKLLEQHHIETENIISEYFKPIQYPARLQADKIKSTIIYKNNSIAASAKNSILEQLEANGEKPKHGCRMGLCKECQCTKNKGIVFNMMTQKFSESTPETIQICVSIPIGEVEII